MKKIIILFGEMGAGKNYWGEKLAKEFGYSFFDGDTVVTPEMLERVSKFKSLTRDMITKYVNHLANEIADRAAESTGLIVAQALYSDQDRQFLKTFLQCLDYDVSFKWIRAPFWRNFKQIYSRPNGFRWVLYWLMNKPFFQKPTHNFDLVQ